MIFWPFAKQNTTRAWCASIESLTRDIIDSPFANKTLHRNLKGLHPILGWNKLHGGWPACTNRNGIFKWKASQSVGFINLCRSHDRLIFIMESHIWKDRLYVEKGSRWARHEIWRVHRRVNGIIALHCTEYCRRHVLQLCWRFRIMYFLLYGNDIYIYIYIYIYHRILSSSYSLYKKTFVEW